jgi:hypothetical protein
MQKFLATLAVLFCLSFSFGGCAEVDDLSVDAESSVSDESSVDESADAIVAKADDVDDYPRNEFGGRIWTWAEVVAEGAQDGTGYATNDTCVDCCFPGACTPICCGSEGGGSGGGGGTAGGGSGGPAPAPCPVGVCYRHCKKLLFCSP